MLPLTIFRSAQFRAANAVTFVGYGALGGFAFVFIPALEVVAGYSPVVAGSALVPVTVVTLLLSALPPITGLTGTAYTHPAQFQSSFAQISWICAAAFACAAVLAATYSTGPGRPAPARPALIQTPVPHLTCPVVLRDAPGPAPGPDSTTWSGRVGFGSKGSTSRPSRDTPAPPASPTPPDPPPVTTQTT